MTLKKGRLITVVVSTMFFEFMVVGCTDQMELESLQGEISRQQAEADEDQAALIISEFDPIIQEIAAREGMDWRFLSAIAWAESNFTVEVRSRAGAVGLMQIMPKVIKSHGYELEDAFDPRVSVELAVLVIKNIESTLRLEGVDELEKVKIILAGYNSGIGNLVRSRREAYQAGVDYNDWEVLREYGRVNNRETRHFVHKVIKQWDYYREIA
ncbi:MAG: transglycosylase SLT domain-containing protein [Rikenellaceae bacterium]